MRKLLLIDDDRTMASLLGSLLKQHGFALACAATPSEGLRRLDGDTTLVLLDVELPEEDGFAVLRRLRDQGDRRPIILLSDREDDQDVIRGLNLGADDFILKPFNYLVLVARIEAALRRAAWASPTAPPGDGIDRNQRVLRLGGRAVALTVTEYRMLEVMTARAGRTFTRGEMWELIDEEGATDSFDRAIDLHVSRLRSKIELNPKEPRHLLTVRGVGYRFEW